MLAAHPIDVMILATDLGVAREFYGDRIGLEVLLESDDFLTFKCGGRRPPRGHPEHHRDQRAADQGLVAGQGPRRRGGRLGSRVIDVEHYDEPGVKIVDGIADVGFALTAWFVDPHGNNARERAEE
jgi:catechol 2,3-dioxygenase-like lactoylglutathione lyase family enzyme